MRRVWRKEERYGKEVGRDRGDWLDKKVEDERRETKEEFVLIPVL